MVKKDGKNILSKRYRKSLMIWYTLKDLDLLVVALELFLVYNKLETTNSLWHMVKQHQTTPRSKAYLVGKLANVTWCEEWDANYFLDN
jgi:hypothetical protein